MLDKKSSFLFGSRSTGKSTLLKKQLKDKCIYIDLLDGATFIKLSANPSELEYIVKSTTKEIVVIDEIQKIPALLDQVHRIIESQKIKFLLTRSSSRILKAGGANL